MNMVALLVVPLVIPYSKLTIDTLKSTSENLFMLTKIPQHFYERLQGMMVEPLGVGAIVIILIALASISWAAIAARSARSNAATSAACTNHPVNIGAVCANSKYYQIDLDPR
jgi:hypothetical protein